MSKINVDFSIERLGAAQRLSPVTGIDFVADEERVLYQTDPREVEDYLCDHLALPSFEAAGARKNIYFNPVGLKCGIVVCGGLCPGINDVIRAIVLSLFYHYGVNDVVGFRYGFEGLNPEYGHEPLLLTPDRVDDIHQKGGAILGTSRGPQDVSVMVDTLEREEINILFAIGGDGTMRGVRAIAEEINRRGGKIAVVGAPKTIDNDIAYVQQTFGFESAVTETSLLLGHNVVHAAMAGSTNMLVGYWRDQFTHVPVSLAVSDRKTINPGGRLWNSVLAATGQPPEIH